MNVLETIEALRSWLVWIGLSTDGTAEIVFTIDCGARVPFSLTSGRLGSSAVTATDPPMRSGEGMTTAETATNVLFAAWQGAGLTVPPICWKCGLFQVHCQFF